MGILTAKDIVERKKELFLSDFQEENVYGANYDLRLGQEVFLSTEEVPRKLSKVNDTVAIRSGEFALLTTLEKISIPETLMGFISLRLTYAIRGLINISGFHVDPGWKGRLVFSVYNAGPNDIVLRYKERMFMIIFEELTEKTFPYKKGEFTPQERLRVEWVSGLRGVPVSIKELDMRVRSHGTQIKIYGGILVSLIVGLILFILSQLSPNIT